jgi:hypothetical protein
MPVEGVPFTSQHYGSQAGVIAMLGPANESTYADIDADGNSVTKAAQEEAALTESDTKVDAYLLGAGITDTIVSTDSDYRFIVYAANRYAAVALSRMRGLPQDGQGRVYDPYKKYVDEADAMMELFVANRINANAASDYPTGPTSGFVSRSNRCNALLNDW